MSGWTDLRRRLPIAVFGMAGVVAVVLYAPRWTFVVLLCAAVAAAAWELIDLLIPGIAPFVRSVVVVLTVAVPALTYQQQRPTLVLLGAALLLLPVTGLLAVFERTNERIHSWRTLGAGLVALLYCGLLPTFLLLLSSAKPDGRRWLLISVVLAWVTDIGSYFTGRSIGRTRMPRALNARKTVEGSIGGVVTGSLVSIALSSILLSQAKFGQLLWLLPTGAVLAQAGDLFESALKRRRGVDDSSRALGAEGGVLDVVDSLWFVGPWVYLAVLIAQ